MSLKSIDMSKLNNLKELLNTDIKTIRKNKGKKANGEGFFSKKNFGKKLIAFDIGSHSAKVVIGERSKDKLIINKAFSFPIEEDMVIDGKILNIDKLSKEIRDKVALNNGKVTDAVCTTNSTSIINREIVVPIGEEGEMETIINFAIQQYLHINMEDYTVQFEILQEVEDNGVKKYKTLVITYPNIMSREYYELLKKSNLDPYALDVTFNSIKKLYSTAEQINGDYLEKEATVAFVDIGNNNINVHIYKNGKLEFTRVIKSGGADLNGSIARNYGITLEEANDRKMKHSDLLNYPSSQEIYEFNQFLREELQQWVGEIQRILQFYKNKTVENRIDKVYIFGGSSNIKGMDSYLRDNLGLSVETIRTISNVVMQDGKAFEDFSLYLNAIGSIIRL